MIRKSMVSGYVSGLLKFIGFPKKNNPLNFWTFMIGLV